VNALGAPEADFPSRRPQCREGVFDMLWTIFVVLLILWVLGFSFHVAGSLIHLLLVVALIVLVFNLISGRRSVL
jgi:Family of unknown function (DUF5670)